MIEIKCRIYKLKIKEQKNKFSKYYFNNYKIKLKKKRIFL